MNGSQEIDDNALTHRPNEDESLWLLGLILHHIMLSQPHGIDNTNDVYIDNGCGGPWGYISLGTRQSQSTITSVTDSCSDKSEFHS